MNNLTKKEKKFIERAATEIVNKIPQKILWKHRKDYIIRLTKDKRFIEKCLNELYKDEK